MDDLRLQASSTCADIVLVSETWLNDEIDDGLIFMNNYSSYRCDRVLRKGGGVAVWVNNTLRSNTLAPVTTAPSTMETIFLKIIGEDFSLICICAYIPPGLVKSEHDCISKFLIFESDRLLSVYPDSKLVFAGDLNDISTDFLQEQLCLENTVTVPTRGGAILDQIWIDPELRRFYPNPAIVGSPLANSDHACVLLLPFSSQSIISPSSLSRSTLVWDYRESNVCEYLRRLSCVDFSSIENACNVDDMCKIFYDLLLKCISAIPCEFATLTVRDKHWMTPVLKCLINKRWRAFHEKNWPEYNHYKEKVRTEILKAKRLWVMKQSNTPRGLWQVVKVFRGSTVNEPWLHLLEEYNNDFKKLLQALSNKFLNNYNSDNDVYLQPLSAENWRFFVSPKMIYDHLIKLNIRKSSGPDCIPPKLLSIGAKFLCGPLSLIFNKSITTKTFPMCFKLANVCPIPKCRSPSISDFRPISLLSPLSKILEKIVLEHMKSDLLRCYGANQHAYRPYGSTTSALVEIHDSIVTALDENDTCAVNVFCLDLTKAFDKLQHNRLINFLNVQGFNNGFLQWLLSYLSCRNIRVKLMDSYGPLVSVPSGVPQVSVLGPYLFAAFIGCIDFCDVNLKCIKYADDITIIERLSKNFAPSIFLDHCELVFRGVDLQVNRLKCKQMCIKRSRVFACDTNSGFLLAPAIKILGVTFDEHLNWNQHVTSILKTASQRLFLIRSLKFSLSRRDLVLVYHSLVTSVLLYASPVFGRLSVSLLNRFERFQRRAHRLICKYDCNCDDFPLLKDKFEQAAVKFLMRCEAIPSHPLHHLVPDRLVFSRKLRLPFCNTSRRLNSFLPWSVMLINTL